MPGKITPLMLAALTAVPLGSALLSSPTFAATHKATSKAKSTKTKTYKGSTINTMWGPIQVDLKVKGKKITGVTVVDPTHTARSQVIASQAIPILKQETLQAQRANINEVSGATTISQAYIQSLQAAVKAAHL